MPAAKRVGTDFQGEGRRSESARRIRQTEPVPRIEGATCSESSDEAGLRSARRAGTARIGALGYSFREDRAMTLAHDAVQESKPAISKAID